MAMQKLPLPVHTPPGEIVYPESDGKPMAETDVHARCIIDVRTMLDDYFAGEPDVYVSGNLLLYYEEGNPRESVAPDVFVVRGVPKGLRRTYRLWQEGQPPSFVLEVSSTSTRWEDQATKRGLYQLLGVQEYVLFDPLGEYLKPPLQGFRLVDGIYQPVSLTPGGGLRSEVLGLELHAEGARLRLFNPATGEYLLTALEEAAARREEAAARRAAQARADNEAAVRRQLEAELARLRVELARRSAAE
jgi:Uma2 family endonuclease